MKPDNQNPQKDPKNGDKRPRKLALIILAVVGVLLISSIYNAIVDS